MVTTELIAAKTNGYSLDLLLSNILHDWCIHSFRIPLALDIMAQISSNSPTYYFWLICFLFFFLWLLYDISIFSNLLITKWKRVTSVKKPSSYQLNQVIKINVINETIQNCVQPDKMQWEEHDITSAVCLSKMHNLLHEKQQKKKFEGHLLNNWLVIVKNVEVISVKNWAFPDWRS